MSAKNINLCVTNTMWRVNPLGHGLLDYDRMVSRCLKSLIYALSCNMKITTL